MKTLKLFKILGVKKRFLFGLKVLDKREMQIIRGGDGDMQDNPVPPPPPPTTIRN